MGLFSKLFGKKPAPAPELPPHLAEALKQPPRLINEGPEFPHGPVVLARTVTPAQIESALAQIGFTRGEECWTRGQTEVRHRSENGTTLLEVTGDPARDVTRELLGVLPWVDPANNFYAEMTNPRTPVEELRYLVCALRHYKCAGGVPMELRRHSDPEIQETVRLIDRDQMAAAARAQRAKRR